MVTATQPTIVNGKITSVAITSAGAGYKVVQHIKLTTNGSGCVLKLTINAKGQVTAVKVEKQGKNYDSKTTNPVRNLVFEVRQPK